MLEMNSRTEMATPEANPTNRQNLRLLIALSLLLVALAVVVVRDRDFWFGPEQAQDSEAAPETVAKTASPAVPAKPASATVTKATIAKTHAAAKASPQTAVTEPASKDAANSPVVATNRVVLPPLDVEVVAGDNHRTVHPGSNVTKVEILNDSNRAPATTAAANLPANAAERAPLPLAAGSVPELRQTIDSTYPLLGQHMKVQGSVVLQAIIGADGNIENLHVLSGPAILATAAQQAVRQWRFKPYFENGQPVETKTRITVNFSIRVADNPSKTS